MSEAAMLSAVSPWELPVYAWWGLAAVCAVLVLGVYPALVLRKYVGIMINLIDEQAPDPGADSRGANGIVGEPIEFSAADGHPLHGFLLRGNPDRPRRGLIIFAHEFDSDHRSCLRYCRFLQDAGYDLFTFDFRGHGLSASEPGYKPRQWASDRELADMTGAIRCMCDNLEGRGLPRVLALFGVSRGAGAAILASVRAPEVEAIIADSAFSSDTTLEYLMKRFATIFARIRVVAENHPPTFWRFLRWLLFREFRRRFGCEFPSVRKAMRRLGRRPVLLIHGGRDSYIPTSQSQLLYDRALGPKQLWIVPDARHNESILTEPREYHRRVLDFLDEHLAWKSAIASPTVRIRPADRATVMPALATSRGGSSSAVPAAAAQDS